MSEEEYEFWFDEDLSLTDFIEADTESEVRNDSM